LPANEDKSSEYPAPISRHSKLRPRHSEAENSTDFLSVDDDTNAYIRQLIDNINCLEDVSQDMDEEKREIFNSLVARMKFLKSPKF
jgi:hypothetical protein